MMKKKGFTLIELMVVMAIIAVLSVLIFGAINITRQGSRNTTRRADAKTFQTALEAYFASNKNYPGTVNTAYNIYSDAAPLRGATGNLTSYLSSFPTSDPGSSANSRVIYCPLSTTTYHLYVINEPTSAPATMACSPLNADGTDKAGHTVYSVK